MKIAFVTVYRFEHQSQEDWRHGKLVSFSSSTNDDGTKHKVTMQAVPEGLRVSADGRTDVVAPAPLGSLWHNDALGTAEMINTLDGTRMKVQTEALGTEPVPIGGQTVPARHIRIDGDLQRDLWYGPDGDLVKVVFPAKDGSTVEYHRAS